MPRRFSNEVASTRLLDRPKTLVLGRVHTADGQLDIAGCTTDLSPAADQTPASSRECMSFKLPHSQMSLPL